MIYKFGTTVYKKPYLYAAYTVINQLFDIHTYLHSTFIRLILPKTLDGA